MVTLNIQVENIKDAAKLAKMLQQIPFVKDIDSDENSLKSVLKKNTHAKRMALMQQAMKDPLFLKDLKEIQEDFQFSDFENLD
ncbi:MAG: hypothetical protein AB8B69_26590 [Chitinophagales bacterium]